MSTGRAAWWHWPQPRMQIERGRALARALNGVCIPALQHVPVVLRAAYCVALQRVIGNRLSRGQLARFITTYRMVCAQAVRYRGNALRTMHNHCAFRGRGAYELTQCTVGQPRAIIHREQQMGMRQVA